MLPIQRVQKLVTYEVPSLFGCCHRRQLSILAVHNKAAH